MPIHWKAVEQYFTVVLFVFQCNPVCNFGKFISFGLGTVKSEGIKILLSWRLDSFNRAQKIGIFIDNCLSSSRVVC